MREIKATLLVADDVELPMSRDMMVGGLYVRLDLPNNGKRKGEYLIMVHNAEKYDIQTKPSIS